MIFDLFFLSAAAIGGLIIVVAYKSAIINDQATYPSLPTVDFCWRLLIGLGCVPGVIALYFRLTIPETPRFTMDIERNVRQAVADVENVLSSGTYTVDPDAVVTRVEAPKASRRDFIAHFGKWENLKVLIGTSYSWFALDVCYIPLFPPPDLIFSRDYSDCFLWSWPQLFHRVDCYRLQRWWKGDWRSQGVQVFEEHLCR